MITAFKGPYFKLESPTYSPVCSSRQPFIQILKSSIHLLMLIADGTHWFFNVQKIWNPSLLLARTLVSKRTMSFSCHIHNFQEKHLSFMLHPQLLKEPCLLLATSLISIRTMSLACHILDFYKKNFFWGVLMV